MAAAPPRRLIAVLTLLTTMSAGVTAASIAVAQAPPEMIRTAPDHLDGAAPRASSAVKAAEPRATLEVAAGPADPIGWDPLSLVGDAAAARRYSLGVDRWEVWICDLPPHGKSDLDAATAAEDLAAELTPYYLWLSGGLYRLQFLPAGTVASNPADSYPCEVAIEQRTGGVADGAFVVSDEHSIPPALAHPDTRSPASLALTPDTFPHNGRIVRAGAYMVAAGSPHLAPKRVAHEVGHTLGWPHSYQSDEPGATQYDNPLDVMSGNLARDGILEDRPQGTPAINRYAAGWITPNQVAIHTVGTARYRLEPIGSVGTQLLILPGGDQGSYLTLDVRVARGYDSGLPHEGVTVHAVDQRPAACANPTDGGCYGHRRRIRPIVPAGGDAGAYDHVLGPGDTLTTATHHIEILDRTGDDYLVEITDPPG